MAPNMTFRKTIVMNELSTKAIIGMGMYAKEKEYYLKMFPNPVKEHGRGLIFTMVKDSTTEIPIEQFIWLERKNKGREGKPAHLFDWGATMKEKNPGDPRRWLVYQGEHMIGVEVDQEKEQISFTGKNMTIKS